MKMIFKCFSILIAVFLMLGVNPTYGQQPASDAGAADDSKSQSTLEDLKILKDKMLSVLPKEETAIGVVLEGLKGRIPDEKLGAIEEKLTDRELSEKQLSLALTDTDLEHDEIKAIMDSVRAYLNFVETIKTVGPMILSADTLQKEISEKKQAREIAHTHEEKTKLSGELISLNDRFKVLERDFSASMGHIGKEQLTQLPVILRNLGYEDEQAGIISDYIRDHVEFAKKMRTVETIIQAMDAVKNNIARKEDDQKIAQTEEERASLGEELKTLSNRLKKLEHDFTIVTTGIDMAKLYEKEDTELDLEKELKDVFSPIVLELRDITDRPRRIEMLRSEVLYYEQRIPEIKQGLEYIEKFIEDVWDEKIHSQLRESEEFWRQQEKEFNTKLETAKHQLFELEKGKMSLEEAANYFVESVLKHRGKNILLAMIAFFAVFLVFHLLRRFIMAVNVLKRIPRYRFLANIMDVLLYILTIVAAISSMFFTLYIEADWLILGLAIIILAGVVWAARNALPLFMEQFRLLLSFGPVRQGERLIHKGIPYKVESIGIYSYLSNPMLKGGTLRLPLKDLIKMRSRPYDKSEVWFPCKLGDILQLGEKRGKVEDITLEYTRLREIPARNLITVPTSGLFSAEVVNRSESLSEGVGLTASIPLSIRNTLEKVELACKLISDILGVYDNITLVWVKIESFDDHAFELRFVYRILGLEKLVARHKIIGEINLAIIRQFKKQSIEFAIKPHVIVSEGPDQENRHETLLNSAVADPAE